MDNSRERDLQHLKDVFTDPTRSLFARKEAYRSFLGIQAQMHDRTLAELRSRLIKSIQAGDNEATDKFERQIRDYAKRQWWYIPRRADTETT